MTQFAVAEKLTDVGLSTTDALRAGAMFGHVSMDVEGYTRRPGFPFHDLSGKAQTVLVHCDGETAIVPRISGGDFWKTAVMLLGKSGHEPTPFVVLPLDRLWIEVVQRMGLQPRELLDREAGK